MLQSTPAENLTPEQALKYRQMNILETTGEEDIPGANSIWFVCSMSWNTSLTKMTLALWNSAPNVETGRLLADHRARFAPCDCILSDEGDFW